MTINELIRAQLEQANSLEAQARAYRKKAGELLILAREHDPAKWFLAAGDERTAQMLIEMATGGKAYA